MRRMTGERGYISVVVLMVAGLLAALVAATMQVSRPTAAYARLNVDELQADALLRGGVAAAAYSLFVGRLDPAKLAGTVVTFATGAVRLSARTERGRIDLNGSPPVLLAGLYRAVNGRGMSAQQFAARVADWRDANGQPGPNGAERPQYREAGLAYGPRNGPFQSVEELMLVLGMTAEDYARLSPHLTIFNPEGTIDPLSASIPVLSSVPGMDARQAQELVAALRAEAPERRAQNRQLQRFSRFLSVEDAQVFRITAEARLLGGFTRTAEAVIVQTDTPQLFDVLAWVDEPAGEGR